MRENTDKAIGARLAVLGAERVLDVGGGRGRSRHATHVIDILSYEGALAGWGRYLEGGPFPRENWVVHDLCSSQPFPFPDKHFDFAICCQTLEDVRDPIHVCQEMSRVAKAGYVESPSPLVELTRGADPGGRSYVGYYHHRWLVDVEDGGLVFVFKPHFLIKSARFHLPPRFVMRWRGEERNLTRLFWEGELQAREKVLVVQEELEEEIERLVRSGRGDILPMKYARFRRRVWKVGTRIADRLHVRDPLRKIIGRMRQWYGAPAG